MEFESITLATVLAEVIEQVHELKTRVDKLENTPTQNDIEIKINEKTLPKHLRYI